MERKELNILFVCIGNTCRSPMAESILLDKCQLYNVKWHVDSAGLRDWNVGYAPEERCVKVLEENGLTTQHIGRMINLEDFHNYDFILCMDEQNLRELESLANRVTKEKLKAKVELLGVYLEREEDKIIRDPYFSNGIEAFRHVFTQINESCDRFLQEHKK